MLRGWNLIGRSGGRWPTPLRQDPAVLFLLVLLLIFFLFTEFWWVTLAFIALVWSLFRVTKVLIAKGVPEDWAMVLPLFGWFVANLVILLLIYG
jgi:hypothetical protein